MSTEELGEEEWRVQLNREVKKSCPVVNLLKLFFS
jgi:hypothetical protein